MMMMLLYTWFPSSKFLYQSFVQKEWGIEFIIFTACLDQMFTPIIRGGLKHNWQTFVATREIFQIHRFSKML